MRAPRRSLRWRLALAIAGLAAVLSTSIGVAVYQLTAGDQLERARAAQAERAALAAGLVRSTGQTLAGVEIDPLRAPAALRRAVAAGRVATYLVRGSSPAIWAGAPLGRGAAGRGVYLRRAFARNERALRQLRDTLLLAGAIGTAAAALLGAILASGLSQRLRRAAAVADRVAAGDHGARIGAQGGDEVARLAHAVDDMSDALASRLAREQRFAADAAHELRTPLTGLTSAAELLDDSRPAQLVRDRIAALRTLVAELLELAQLDAGEGGPAEREPLELEALLRRLIARRAAPVALELEQRSTLVISDRRRLDRIVGNLLDNAQRHGREPVVVRLAGTTIEVGDHGPGFPAELLRDGPQRFWTAAGARGGGSGLGLTIAAGHAAVIGAPLTFSNRLEGGAVARLGPFVPAGHCPPTAGRPRRSAHGGS